MRNYRVSIHAPRVEGDLGTAPVPWSLGVVSIHAPRVEGDKVQLSAMVKG